ncbi:MAG: dihydrolipoyl dehydrogenase [Nitrososphaerales archaeon]|nr:dihydrolipoyl dehydrogenase [Nitrososphaerales archaeon]
MDSFDITVIGGGPGGYVCAIRAAQLGLKTAIVEMEKLGGECLNYGCIPSKSLITVSKLYDKVKQAERFGLNASGVSVDYAQMQKWKSEVVGKLVSGVEYLLKGNHVTIVHGEAEILDRNTIAVQTASGREEFSTKKIVIATGTRPIQLPGIEYDGSLVIGSKEALDLMKAPRRLVIIGGGAIGLEFASMYQNLGSNVTIVEVMDQLLPGSDPEVVRVVHKKLESRGASIHLRSSVTSVSKRDGVTKLEVDTPEGKLMVEADVVLQSVGRRPRTERLNLQKVGVNTDQKGFIVTDSRMMTNVEGIYAIGDVRGPPLLAHKASKEGIVAAESAAGLPTAAEWTVIPDAVFCDPEVASVGLTEAKALAAGHEVKKTRFQFSALGRALSTGEAEGFVKVVSETKSGLVLGVQIVGPEASNLISEAALAIEMGATVEDIALTMHPHPTLPEAIMEAAESAAGRPIHQLRT